MDLTKFERFVGEEILVLHKDGQNDTIAKGILRSVSGECLEVETPKTILFIDNSAVLKVKFSKADSEITYYGGEYE